MQYCRFVSILLLLLAGGGAESGSRPSLDSVMSAIGRQDSASFIARFTYSVAEIGRPNGIQNEGLPLDSAGRAAESSYARTPEMIWLSRPSERSEASGERDGIAGIKETRVLSGPEGFRAGILTIGKGAESYWKERNRPETYLLPMPCRSDDPSTFCLAGWLKYVKSPLLPINDGGKELWKAVIADTGDSQMKRCEILFDPARNCTPVKVYVAGTDSESRAFEQTVETREFIEVKADVWFPKEQVMTLNYSENNHTVTTRYKVAGIISEGDLSAGRFRVAFPKGTQVNKRTPDGKGSVFVQD